MKNEKMMGLALSAAVALSGVSFARAEKFPDSVGGVITLEVASGSVTYDEALGSATKLVKQGAGEAILSVATDAFAGEVEVQAGTLKVTHGKAVGTTSPITVSDGATFWLYANDYTSQGEQETDYFAGHTITISGKGVDGNGALRCGAPTWKMYDRALGTLNLAADATIGLNIRFGFRTAINLNGHTLTSVGGGNWMIQNMGSIGAGTIVDQGNTLTLQGTAPKSDDPTATHLFMTNRSLTFWSAKPIGWSITAQLATLQPDAGKGNALTGPLTFLDGRSYLANNGSRGQDLSLDGPIVIKSETTGANVFKLHAGKVFVNGPITMDNGTVSRWNTGILNGGMGWLIMTSNVDRVIGHYTVKSDSGIGAKLWLGAGSLRTTAMLRLANGMGSGGVLWQTGGVYVNGNNDEGRIGESSNAYGGYVLDGGEAHFSNGVYVAEGVDSRGLVKQTGGFFEVVSGANLHLGHRGRGEFYTFGGTNFFGNTKWAAGVEMSRHVSDAKAGQSTFVVSGKDTLSTVSQLTAGCSTNDNSTCVVSIKDGGTLVASRFYRFGGKAYAFVDNGTIYNTIWGGWGHQDYTSKNFMPGGFTKFVILSGGLTFDMSKCGDWDHKTMGSGWIPHVFCSPSGKRISKINLPTDEAFTSAKYFAPATVTITGNGWGATAFADFDFTTEKITGIVITSGGCDYDETTKVTLHSPDGKSSYACTFELAENEPGGAFTKRGAYNLTLAGEQQYTGGTIVEEGSLTFLSDAEAAAGAKGIWPANTPLTVKRGANLNCSGQAIAISKLSGEGKVSCTQATVSEIHVRLADLYAEGHTPLTFSGPLALADGAKVVVDDPENFATYAKERSRKVLTATSLTGTASFETPAGVYPLWTVRLTDNTLSFGPSVGMMILVK